MYYNYDKRLEEDAKKAEKEWDFVENVLNGIKQSSIGSAVSIIRLLSFILPIIALLMPVFKIDNQNITLVTLVKNIISDSGSVFNSTAYILCFAAFAAVVIFALLSAFISLFSFTKNGFKRNKIISAVSITVFCMLSMVAVINGCSISYGVFAVIVFQIITVILHFAQQHNVVKEG